MPQKDKSKNKLTHHTSKRKGNQISKRNQQPPPPELSLTDTEVPGLNKDEEPSLNFIMTLLVDMNACLDTYKQRVDSLADENETRPHIPFNSPRLT